jgi:hypothetical protein
MSDFLTSMAASSSRRAQAARADFTADELGRPVYPVRFDGFGVIAEIKKRSPAEGDLSAQAGSLASRARTYVDGGASAISVLTEPDRFDGALADLEAVVDAVDGRDVHVAPGSAVLFQEGLHSLIQILLLGGRRCVGRQDHHRRDRQKDRRCCTSNR